MKKFGTIYGIDQPFRTALKHQQERRDITSTKEGYVALEMVVVVKDQKFRWHLPFQLQQNQ